MTSSEQPAIFAGIASISTVELSGVTPPGTQSPTFSMGSTFCPSTRPSSSMRKPVRSCFVWNARMFAAARSRIARKAGSTASRAAAVSSGRTSSASSFAFSNFSLYSSSAASPRARTSRRMSATTAETSISGTARAKISSGGTSPNRMSFIIPAPPLSVPPAPHGAGR